MIPMSGGLFAPVVQGWREFGAEEIEEIRRTVEWLPRLGRRELARTLCEHLGWYSASGAPQEHACLKLLSKLEAQGVVRLPAGRAGRPGAGGRKSPLLTERTRAPGTLAGTVADYAPVEFEVVSEEEAVGLWNEYVERYHPLGYRWSFGNRLRYFIVAGPHRLGCLGLAGAAKAITTRDRWIGWSERQRLRNLSWVLNNTRFLIFPWVRIANLASHVLGKLARRVGHDWETHFGFRPLLLETFVDPQRFAGTCYRAAGWTALGSTTGKGLVRAGYRYTTHPKLIFAKPLDGQFRSLLCSHSLTAQGWDDE